jgi:hypothetical protein
MDQHEARDIARASCRFRRSATQRGPGRVVSEPSVLAVGPAGTPDLERPIGLGWSRRSRVRGRRQFSSIASAELRDAWAGFSWSTMGSLGSAGRGLETRCHNARSPRTREQAITTAVATRAVISVPGQPLAQAMAPAHRESGSWRHLTSNVIGGLSLQCHERFVE